MCQFMEVGEGLEKSVEFLKSLILEKPTGSKWREHVGMQRAGGLNVQQRINQIRNHMAPATDFHQENLLRTATLVSGRCVHGYTGVEL